MLSAAGNDPYACDGSVEMYLGEHVTNKLPQGGKLLRGDAFVDSGILHITDESHNERLFMLKIPLPKQVSNHNVLRGSFDGRFPWGYGESLKCQAKLNLNDGRVRVDSFEDSSLWFEVALFP